jgi:nitronate monooxygenase
MQIPKLVRLSQSILVLHSHMTSSSGGSVNTELASVCWKTRLTQQVPSCRVPIVGAPMAGHAGGAMAAAVCRSGGLGFIAAGHALATTATGNDDLDGVSKLNREIEIFREHEQEHALLSTTTTATPYPLCLGFLGYAMFADEAGWQRFQHILQTYQPAVVQFFCPAVSHHATHVSNIVLAQRHGARVYAQVGTVADTMEAVQAGVDGLILQGMEAGGHGLRRECGSGTLSLAANVLDKLRGSQRYEKKGMAQSTMPILAAGGIADGYTMAAALALGCDGVVVGTRLCASPESLGRASFQEHLVAAESCDSVIRTTTFDAVYNVNADHPWPEPYDAVGALRNEMSQRWEGKSAELAAILDKQGKESDIVSTFQRAQMEGNASEAVVLAGEGVGLIDRIEPAHEIVAHMSQTAATVLQNLPRQLFLN